MRLWAVFADQLPKVPGGKLRDRPASNEQRHHERARAAQQDGLQPEPVPIVWGRSMETVTVGPRLARGRTTNKTTFTGVHQTHRRVSAPLRLGPLGMNVEPVDPALPLSEGHSHGDHDVALAAEKERHFPWFPSDPIRLVVVTVRGGCSAAQQRSSANVRTCRDPRSSRSGILLQDALTWREPGADRAAGRSLERWALVLAWLARWVSPSTGGLEDTPVNRARILEAP